MHEDCFIRINEKVGENIGAQLVPLGKQTVDTDLYQT